MDTNVEISEYQGLAIRTAKPLPTLADNLVHAALGIGSEAGELSKTITAAWLQMPFDVNNIHEEIGDGCWYAALMCETMGWRFEDTMIDPNIIPDMSMELSGAILTRNPPALTLLLNHFAGEILSIVKAHTIYGKELDHTLLWNNLCLYCTAMSLISDIHGIEFEDVTLLNNIAKLRKRYPDAYSDAAALARADKPVIIQ